MTLEYGDSPRTARAEDTTATTQETSHQVQERQTLLFTLQEILASQGSESQIGGETAQGTSQVPRVRHSVTQVPEGQQV
jgi:uncharacterized membrane protein YjjP (DUF1212 family)